MKESRRLELQAQLDQAVSNNDTASADAIRHTIDRETLECTAHTAERLKRVELDVSEIKETVFDIKDELRDMKAASKTTDAHDKGVQEGAHLVTDAHAKGAKEGATLVIEILKLIVSAGGGAALIKFLPT